MFNHQARWDRNLPQDNRPPQGTPIAVTCVIHKGDIVPEAFVWGRRTLRVNKINFRWKDRQGTETLFVFSVATEAGTYEIVFCAETLSWKLRNILGP